MKTVAILSGNYNLESYSYEYRILWDSYISDESKQIISIPRIIEDNSASIRSQYLKWVYELGNKRYLKKNIIDELKLTEDYSQWWVNLIAESRNTLSPVYNEVIRLLALDLWCQSNDFTNIVLISENKLIIPSISSIARKYNCNFKYIKIKSNRKTKANIKIRYRLYSILPPLLKSLSWLIRYIYIKKDLIGIGKEKFINFESQFLFVSYLFNIDPKSYRQDQFFSNYWTDLPQKLIDQGIAISWLHLYVPGKEIPNSKEAAVAINKFNIEEQSSHTTLDCFLSFNVIIETVLLWKKIALKWFYLKNYLRLHPIKDINISYLLNEQWKESFLGPSSLSSILNYVLMRNAIPRVKNNSKCFYLMEYQAWEMALIDSWKKYHQNSIIGVIHATIPFWDISYFKDERTYKNKSSNLAKLPDAIAVNGPNSYRKLIESNIKIENIYKVEALRYLYLESNKKFVEEHNTFSINEKEIKTLLVLGDANRDLTHKQLITLEESLKLKQINLNVIFKPHPLCNIETKYYSGLDFKVSNMPLKILLKESSFTFTSIITSAAVEALYMGIPLITLLDSSQLNISPLHDSPNVDFVENAKELAISLDKLIKFDKDLFDNESYFFLGGRLEMWMSLIKSLEKH